MVRLAKISLSIILDCVCVLAGMMLMGGYVSDIAQSSLRLQI